MINDLKFLVSNVCFPVAKINVSIGTNDLSLRYKKAFTARSWKRLFIPQKKYNCSLIDLNKFDKLDSYLQAINGKNSAAYYSRRCQKLNYRWELFDPNDFIDDIFNINTSKTERQGRVMDQNYLIKVESWPSDELNKWIGVFDGESRLVSYVWLVLLNQLVLINRILGHSKHLNNNVMYLNMVGAMEHVFKNETPQISIVMYDTFGRKKNGLVLFKKRLGFQPYTVNFS